MILKIIAWIILILLLIPIRVTLQYENTFQYKVFYGLIKLYPKANKQKKEKKLDESADDAFESDVLSEDDDDKTETAEETEIESSDTKSDEEKEQSTGQKESKSEKKSKPNEKAGKSLSEKLLLIKEAIEAVIFPLKMIFKGIFICGLSLQCIVGGEDASSCAISFGRWNGIIYPAVAFLNRFFTLVFPKKIILQIDYDAPETQFQSKCCIFTLPLILLLAVLCFAVNFIIIHIKGRFQSKS